MFGENYIKSIISTGKRGIIVVSKICVVGFSSVRSGRVDPLFTVKVDDEERLPLCGSFGGRSVQLREFCSKR